MVGVSGQAEKRLKTMGVMTRIPTQNILSDRTMALRQAVNYVDEYAGGFDRGTVPPQAIG